jgi:signal transduction histidine kinase
MWSASQPPPHPRTSGVSFPTTGDAPPPGGSASGHGGADHGGEPPIAPEFFAEALDAAMALVHADSGELATLDDTRQRLVLRARRTRPRLESTFGGIGAIGTPSRISQPLLANIVTRDAMGEIDQQATDLLPGVMLTRTYRPGERLIGYTWQRGDAVIMRGEDCRALYSGTAPADPDAPWHLAVPIHRPGPFSSPRASRQIIGVIAVHNRDPLWQFSARDVELLTLHADRVAGSMKANEMAWLNEGQAALLDVLRGTSGSMPELPGLYLRVRDVVRRLIDAPSFGLLKYDQSRDELVFALAERDERPVATTPFAAAAAPRWWPEVRAGRMVCVTAPEDYALHHDYCVLGFGGDDAVQSLMAAPLVVGKTLMGAIVAGSPRTDSYPPEHVKLFKTVAWSAAVVIENAELSARNIRALQQARVKAEQLSILNNSALTLNASLDLPTTLRQLARQAKGLTDAQMCRVFLLNDEGTAFVSRATNLDRDRPAPAAQEPGAPASEDVVESPEIPWGWRDLGLLLRTQQYVHWDDLASEWNAATPLGRLLGEERVSATLIVPIVAPERERPDEVASHDRQEQQRVETLGALWVYTPGVRHSFPAEQIVLLEGLASQAAIAITNAKLFRQVEQAYERQKELDRYKDEFILTVSHEFRTPLTAIDGYVGLIGRHGPNLPKEKLEQFAQEIRLATSQLASMINMLADANRMTSQQLQLTLRPVHLQTVAQTAMRQQPPQSQARIHMAVDSDIWVPADPERLNQVVSNLLSNALKYSPEAMPCEVGARVESREALARAGRVHAAMDGAPARWVVVTVTDHGDGVAPEEQQRLFQKFVRLARSLVTSVRGTGLGLWICRQYVEAMGGDIWVESAVNEGSRFSFSLPLGTPPAGA